MPKPTTVAASAAAPRATQPVQAAPVTSDTATPPPPQPRIVSVGPGGFLRQGPGDQQAPIPPAPPRRLVPAKPRTEIADKPSLLDLTAKNFQWPKGHPDNTQFHAKK